MLCCFFLSCVLHAQSIIGAWENFSKTENGDQLRNIVIFADGYQVLSTFDANTGKFIHTNGGTWKLDGDVMTEKVEFHTDKPEMVGTEKSFKVNITENEIGIADSGLKFTRIDNGTPGALQGAWLMSGRIRDGETQTRDTNQPRKTMKIISGTRFQWIAYNTETKQFMGTGGGTYTTKNGEYKENIEFFSRDDSKAGLSLKFNYELIGGKWHHSGLSSKGDPIHEIWSIRENPDNYRETLEKKSSPEADKRIQELNQYWADLAKTAKEGDYEGMWSLYHDDAVLVKPDTTIAISDAFKYRWKKEIMEVKEGHRANALEFRFSKRIGNEKTAFEKGIYHYTSVDTATDKILASAYIHFETLLVKVNNEWVALMEYQKTEATDEEWQSLK
jgi:ketosteroid isomerase-like protein